MPKLSGNVSNFSFEVSGLGEELKVYEFKGEETISRLFHYHLTLVSENAALDFEKIVGKPAVLTFYDNEKKEERHVNGIIGRFVQTDDGNRYTTYNALLVPQVWNMQFHHDCRIFQQKTIQQIIKEVLDSAGIPAEGYKFTLQGTYKPRDYCVQYRESDLNFIQRLMEQEGMLYFFEHTKEGHVLHIADHLSSHQPIASPDKIIYNPPSGSVPSEESVFPFIYSEEIRPGAVAITDYDFTKPSLNLMSSKQYEKDKALEIYDYPGEYVEQAEGARYANLQMESWQVARKKGHGEADVMRLTAGYKFSLEAHPRSEFNKEYLLTRVIFYAKQPGVVGERGGGAGDFNAEFHCIPADVQFRPMAITPKPVVEGIQTAIVVGPAGEEIFTDEHGRVKVQFHWDRVGKKDDKSSCWIRVSQTWAGQSWGTIHIPRIGHEVIVDFIEGDPDRPLITGRVYHGTNVPPYPLPDEKNKSGIKSNSTIGGAGYNEMIFDDTKGSELIRFHGQKDWDIHIKNNKTQMIGHNERLTVMNFRDKVVGVNQTESIGVNKTISVGKDHNENIGSNYIQGIGNNVTINIGKNSYETIGKDHTEEVGQNRTLRVAKDETIEIGDDSSKTVKKKTVINSGDEITLKCGKSSIVMKKDGKIQIQGKDILIKGSGNITIKGKKIAEN